MAEWPIHNNGVSYHPIPDSWIEHGRDEPGVTRSIYAVSVGRVAKRTLSIRYLAPTKPKVLDVTTAAAPHPTETELVPADLANNHSWLRSVTVPKGVEPSDVARSPEIEHLRELWGGRVTEVPPPGEPTTVLADGGPLVETVNDLSDGDCDG